MFAVMSPEELAEFNAGRDAAISKAEEARASLSVRSRPGTCTIVCLFMGEQVRKVTAGSTAAAGQSGSAKGKDPPKSLKCIPLSIKKLAADHVDGCEYVIVNPNTIGIPCRDQKLIGACRDLVAAVEKKISDSGANATPELEAELTDAKAKYTVAQKIIGYKNLSQGAMTFVSCFMSSALLANFKPNTLVKITGVGGSFSKSKGVEYFGIDCQALLPMGDAGGPFISIGKNLDLFQQPVRPPRLEDADKKYGDSFTIFFSDYFQTAADRAQNRGPVLQRRLTLSTNEKDWKWGGKKEGEEAKLMGKWEMMQKQDGSVPGYPAGDFLITATIIEGEWNETSKQIALRQGFGFVDTNIWTKVMSANPVPGLIQCSVNNEKTVDEARKGNPHIIACWANEPSFMLRDYLLKNSPRVSWAYVRKNMGIKQNTLDEDAAIQRDNPNRQCLLNRRNLMLKDNQMMLINDKVVSITNYSGNIYDFERQGAEWRVMISAPLDQHDRWQLGALPTAEAEKVLQGISDVMTIPTDGLVRIFFAVMPRTEAELVEIEEACNSWKTERDEIDAKKAASAAAEEEAALTAEAQRAEFEGTAHQPQDDEQQQQPMDTGNDEDEAALAAAMAYEADHPVAAATPPPAAPVDHDVPPPVPAKKKVVKRERKEADDTAPPATAVTADPGAAVAAPSPAKKKVVKRPVAAASSKAQ